MANISIGDYLEMGTSLLSNIYKRRLNLLTSPRVMAYTVTWRCNALCEMCGIKNIDNKIKNKNFELSAKEVSSIFKDPMLRRFDLIRFTGGEPFLKEDFVDIVNEIARNTKTKIYYITTNGFYSQKIFEFVERISPLVPNLTIQVSLDAKGEAHDNIRKLPGLYEKAMQTLKGLSDLKKIYKFNFGINQTLMPSTLDYMEDLSDICDRLGCDHKIYLGYDAHESDILEGAKLNSKLTLISNPNENETNDLYARIEKHYNNKKTMKRNLSLSENLWDIVEKHVFLGSKNRVLHGLNSPNPPCLAMFYYFRLLPDGTVMPCTLKPKEIGSLKNKTFSEIWRSETAMKMRSEVKKCQGCWVECDIVPNIVYSFDVVREALKKWRRYR